MNTVTIHNTQIGPLDALWTIFKTQPKSVRKAFMERLLKEDVEAQAIRNQMVVKQSITKALKELSDAEQSGIELPDARNLFK